MTNRLDQLLSQLESKIPFGDSLNQEVSQTNVAWHIEHSLLVLNGATRAMIKSNPKEYKWTFNLTKTLVLITRRVPRGKAKAPKMVQPNETSKERLQTHIQTIRELIKGLEALPKKHFFNHPYFGHLKLKQGITFLEVHTSHHLKIIDDIIGNRT